MRRMREGGRRSKEDVKEKPDEQRKSPKRLPRMAALPQPTKRRRGRPRKSEKAEETAAAAKKEAAAEMPEPGKPKR